MSAPLALISFLFSFRLEKYLQECWPIVKGALKEYGIAGELNLVSQSHIPVQLFPPTFTLFDECRFYFTLTKDWESQLKLPICKESEKNVFSLFLIVFDYSLDDFLLSG